MAEARLALRRPRRAVRHHHQRLAHLPEHGRINASNPCSEYMFLDDTACNLAAQPDEVPPRGRRVRRRSVPGRVPHAHHRPGNPGRQRQLPDAGDRAQQPRLPAAGPGLRQPRRAAHGPRPAVRLRCRPQLRGRHHRPDARRGLRAERADGGSHGPVRRLRGEPRADAARHRQASPARPQDRRRTWCRKTCCARRSTSGTRPTRSACSTATATARSPCWRPPAPSAS